MGWPLTVDVSEIRKRLGSTTVVTVDHHLDPVAVLESRSTGAPVTGHLTLSSIERGVTVDGVIAFGWKGECRRCLDEVTGLIESRVQEIFQIGAGDDSELWDFDGVTIDLDPVIREAMLAGLPLAPLCAPDCAGPDPERFPTGQADESAERPAVDPRWAALDAIQLGDDAPS